MRRMWLAAVLAMTFTWLLPAAAGAQDKPIELKFSSWVSAVHGHHTGVMVPWAKMVEEKSGGRLKITIFPGSTLGKAVDHYDMVKDGIADMGFTTPGYTPGRFPLITATSCRCCSSRRAAAAWPSCRSSTSTSRRSSRT